MSKPKRLHPISAVENFVRQLKDLIIPFIIVFLFGQGRLEGGEWYERVPLIIFAAVLIWVFAAGIIRWYRFTYRLEEGELRIEYGLIVKKKRFIPFERIQSLDFSEGILLRPFKLVKVSVETAGSGSDHAEASLSAITKEEARTLQQAIAESKNKHAVAEHSEQNVAPENGALAEDGEVLYRITKPQLLFMASTSGQIGVVLSAAAAFLSQIDDIIPYKKIFSEFEHLARIGSYVVAFLVVGGLFVAWLLSVILTILKYNDFTLTRIGDDLVITRGLLEKRQTTIPIRRIQAVAIKESPIRQPFGYAGVSIESAGGSIMEKDSSTVMILPVIKKRRIAEILEDQLEGYQFSSVRLNPPPGRAKLRYVFVQLACELAITIAACFYLGAYGLLAGLLMLVTLVLGHFRFQSAGWQINNGQLVLRNRGIQQHTVFMRKNRIQAITESVNLFQKKAALASVTAEVKSGMGSRSTTVKHLDERDAADIFQWLHP